jgi:photosynthetic reaction center H subunit
MEIGAITQYVDVAQLVLYGFWAFFFGLVYYLVRENHREGYPLETLRGRGVITGWPRPTPKVFKLAHGGEVVVPGSYRDQRPLAAEPMHGWSGAPLEPTGDPMLGGVGPGAWAERANRPDLTFDGSNKLVPLRLAGDYGVSFQDVDPRGLTVHGADGEPGGTVVDLWVDMAEALFRYLEVELAGGSRRVLVPMNFARVRRDRVRGDRVVVQALYGQHFAAVPATAHHDQVTMLEEERIQAYFGAGTLYADPRRAESML